MIRLLLVEDDSDFVTEVTAAVFSKLDEHIEVQCADNARSAVECILRGAPHLVIMDMALPATPGAKAQTASGRGLLERVLGTYPWIRVVVLSGQSREFAVGLLTSHRNIRDYLFKDSTHAEMVARLGKQLEEIRTEQATREMSSETLIGQGPAMARLKSLIARVAPEPVSVLVLGETGTGKELVAREVHRLSPRSGGPLVSVNCAAFAESVLESEVFGHVRGAFTGATEDRVGRFEAAHGGTLFLDEVGELGEALQVKLLRFLQERQFEPVGSSRTRRVDVRIVLATNRDLEVAVRQGRMRQDFYYRVRGVVLHVPPLRERKEDLPELARAFLSRHAERRRRSVPTLAAESLVRLGAHDWPGNVRELQSVMEEASLFAEGDRITLESLPWPLSRAVVTAEISPEHHGNLSGGTADRGATLTLEQRLERFERDVLAETMEACDHDVTQAAARLGMERRTLHNRLNHHRISRKRKRFDAV